MKCELNCTVHVENPAMADIPSVLAQLIGFLRDHGVIDDRYIREFELAASESLSNAIKHGNAASENPFVRAQLNLNPDYAELRVTDPSDFGGPATLPCLPEDPFSECGRGIYIMSQLCDEVTHEREKGKHAVLLRKNFPVSQWEYQPGKSDRVASELVDELVVSYELVNTLVSLSEWVAIAPDIMTFIDGALEKICSVTESDTAFLRIEKMGRLSLMRLWGDQPQTPFADLLISDPGVETQSFCSGKEITVTAKSFLAENDPLREMVHNAFVVPVVFKGKTLGVLVIAHTRSCPYFDAWKLKVVRMVADYIGITVTVGELQRKRTSELLALRELEIASQIQLSLMPQDFESVEGLDLYGICLPALQSGGDYFDFLVLPGGSVLITIADVMGKGISAALLATMLRTNLHAVVSEGESDPGKILTKISKLMSKDLIKLEIFITMVCTWISPDRKKILNSSAGHLAALHQRANGKITQLEGTGIPIGIFHNTVYESAPGVFKEGERLLVFTDGVTEAVGQNGTMFELQRVKQCLTKSRGLPSREAVRKLLDDVSAFTGDEKPFDDRTLILISRIS